MSVIVIKKLLTDLIILSFRSATFVACVTEFKYTVSGKKRPPPKQNAVKCTVYNTIQ